jgi:hypothetical protein
VMTPLSRGTARRARTRHSCGATPGSNPLLPPMRRVKDVEGPFCEPCAKAVERGRFCAACSTVYREDDKNMICCDDCKARARARRGCSFVLRFVVISSH